MRSPGQRLDLAQRLGESRIVQAAQRPAHTLETLRHQRLRHRCHGFAQGYGHTSILADTTDKKRRQRLDG
jgi:hypothetical protein